jgi:hypothetical protein
MSPEIEITVIFIQAQYLNSLHDLEITLSLSFTAFTVSVVRCHLILGLSRCKEDVVRYVDDISVSVAEADLYVINVVPIIN